MSVPEQVPYKEYRATGSNNSFEITFYLPDPKDLVVMVNKEIPPVGAYSIQDNTVVFNTPPNEGDLVELTRDTQLDRETNFKSYDNSFRPETINFDLDKIWLVLQESNLVDAKILARLKQEIEWRRTHDFNYDELAQVREKQLFDALKGYTDTLNAATNPGVFQGVIAGVVFARDGKSIQTHLEEILESLAQERENIDLKADQTYVEEQLDLKANQDTTYSKTEVDSALDQKASKVDIYTKPEVDTALSAVAAGHKAYTTLALAQAAQGTLLANTIIEVTNDPTASNNGTYQWNGTTLTKSAYDPLTQAKADATTKANAAEANAKNYFKTNGTGVLIPANSAVINFDTATAVLSFTGTFYIISNDTTVASLTTPQSFTLTSSNPYRIECDPVTNTLFAVSYSAAKTAGRVVLGWIRTPSATLGLEVSGFKVSVNGVAAQRSENGSLIASDPVRINFDNTNKKLILHSAVRVKSPTFTTTPNATVEIPYPSSGTYKLVFNRETNGFLFVLVSTLGTSIDLNRIELATVVFSTTAVTNVYGIDNYTIDGSVVSAGGGASLNATLTASVASDVNFSFVQNKMTLVSQKVRINYDKVSVLLPAVELNLLNVESRFWQKLIFNKSTQAFSAKQFSSSLSDNELVFALVQPLTKSVVGIADYYVEGKPVKYTPREAPHLATYGDLRPLYVQPTLPEFWTSLISFGSDFTKIYDLYDALVAAHPSYVTKSLMGVDGFGNQMFSYQFSTAEVTTTDHGNKKNKFIIFSGIHGGEKGGIYNVYNAMKQICERHADDPNLHALKYGVNFIVVPICSPSGFQIGFRKNGNGVDIARNFPTGWALVSNPESEIYGGAAPADQVETQLMLALMEQHKDALCFTSHHNFTAETQLAWVSARSNAQVNMCKSLIINESVKAKKQYGWINQSDSYYIGYVSLGAEGNGMEASHAFAMGMYANTIEVGMVVPDEAGKPIYSSAFATLACQFFINYLLCTVDDAVKFHNSQIDYYR